THFLAEGRVDGDDPLAAFSENAPQHLLRTDGFEHVADIMVGSFYDPSLGEGCAFEELISFHGGIGGVQEKHFLLFLSGLPLTCSCNGADGVLVSLTSITRVTSLTTSGVARTDSTLSLSLVALASISALALLVFGGEGLDGFVGILSGLLTVATIGTVALGVIDQGDANVRAVPGAVRR